MPSGYKICLSAQVQEEIITKYLSGSSALELANYFGFKCSKSIIKILKDNSISTRNHAAARQIKKIVFNEQDIAQILLMNANPLISLLDIAKKFNRDPKIIKRQLIECNTYDPLKYDKFLIGKFDQIVSEEQSYWLGMLAADGSVTNKQLILQLAEVDIDHVIKFKNFIGVDYKISKTITNLNGELFNGYRYVVSSSNFVKSLVKHGLVPKKSITLEFPKTIPNELIRHYIRGLVDGDGSFSIDKSDRLHFSLVSSLDVCKEVQRHLIKNCNINETKLYEMISKIGEKYYYLNYCGSKQCCRIADYLYDDATIFLDRKKFLIDTFKSNHKFIGNKYT